MAENLRQSNEVIAVVFEKLVRHRVPQQVREQLDPGDGAVPVAHGPDSTIRQRPSLADEDVPAGDRWTAIEVSLNRTPGHNRQWDGALFAAFAESEYNCAAAFTQSGPCDALQPSRRDHALRIILADLLADVRRLQGRLLDLGNP